MIAGDGGQSPSPIAVAVLAGDAARRRQLVALLEPDARVDVVTSDGGSRIAAVDAVAARAPDGDGNGGAVVLVDVPSRLGDDVDLVRSIAGRTDGVAIVVVGPEPDLALATLIAGASGVVPREPSAQELFEAVACVACGGAAVTPEVATTLVNRYQDLGED